MANRFPAPRAPIILILGASTLLTGCIAAIVPVATGALAGRRALQHRPSEVQTRAAANTVAAQSPQRPPVSSTDRSATPAVPVGRSAASPPSAPNSSPATAPRPATPPSPAPAPAPASSWYDVVRYAGHEAAATPGRTRTTVMPLAKDGSYPDCGTLPLAAVVAAGAIGVRDALNVGALSTIGLEVVFTAGPAGLSSAQLKALAKQNVPAPSVGQTLFPSPSGGEGAARQAIGRRYCVIVIVGARAADFPYGVVPGAPRSHEGWFLVRPAPAAR